MGLDELGISVPFYHKDFLKDRSLPPLLFEKKLSSLQ